MTTTMTEAEGVLQAALDESPWSATLRKVLADHLEDVGDERFAGYRALGALGLSPYLGDNHVPASESFAPEVFATGYAGDDGERFPPSPHGRLSDVWLNAMPRNPKQIQGRRWRTFPTRREADDAAALAFARLPADVQAVILAGATT